MLKLNIMKKLLIISLILGFVSCKAQTIMQEQPLENRTTTTTGVYYKDFDNFLNTFEGTYLYSNGNTSFNIILQKKIKSSINGRYEEDILIGGYRYIENGVEKINTLNALNTTLPNGWFYPINGNNIMEGKMRCPTCDDNEKWILADIKDPVGHHVNELFIRKTSIGGQDAIKIFIYHALESASPDNAPAPLPINHPINQEFILVKQ
jgi:hypothetical protein